MKTPEEIKIGINCDRPCMACPYHDKISSDEGCGYYVNNDTLAYIQQLEEQIDLMKIQMQGDCGVCKHWNSGKCDACLKNTGRPLWEYEGLPK